MLAALALCVLAQDVVKAVDIHGRVTRPDGSAAAGVTVTYTRGARPGHDLPVAGPGASPRGPLPEPDGQVTCAADGSFALRGLAPGTWSLRVLQAPHLWLDRTLVVGPEGRRDVRLELTDGVRLEGRLTLPEGASLADFRLDVTCPDRYWAPRDGGFRVVLHPDGRYAAGPLPVTAARVVLRRSVPLGRGSSVGHAYTLADPVLDSRPVQRQDIDVRETFPAWVRARVQVDGARAPDGLLVLLDDGTPDAGWAPSPSARHLGPWPLLDVGQTLRRGDAVLGFAAPGRYAVVVVDERRGWAWRRPEPLVVAAGARVALDEDVRLFTRRVRFSDARGAPLAGADVRWATCGCELDGARRRADGAGELEFTLPAGDLELFLGPDGPAATLAWPPAGTADVTLTRD